MEITSEHTDTAAAILQIALSEKTGLPISTITLDKAKSALLKLGIPEVKNERYKYANVQNILNQNNLQTSYSTTSQNYTLVDSFKMFPGKNLLVTVNGKIVKTELSSGFSVSSVSDYLAFHPQVQFDDTDAMQALAVLTAKEGFHLKISAASNEPLIWLNITDTGHPSYLSSLNCIEAASGCENEILEIRIGRNSVSFTNQLTIIKTGESCTLRILSTDENLHSVSGVFSMNAEQEKGSTFSHSILGTGSPFMRQNILAEHKGENCHTELNGFYAVNGTRQADFYTIVKHMFPNCTSDEMYKGIAADQSKAIFNGKVYVARDAQKTNAYQSNKNILLSEEALIRSKPELEIYADDVKCSHGSTTGQTDQKSLFYLQSRGIRENEARKMLMLAFAGEVFERISNEQLRDFFTSAAENKLMEILN